MRCIRLPQSRHILCRASLLDNASTNKKAAVAFGTLATVGATTFHFLSKQPVLPPIQDVLLATTATVGGVGLGSIALAKAVFQDTFHIEWHRGRFYFCIGVPSSGPLFDPGAIIVKPTGDVRGNGAYATTTIPSGTYLGDYTGEILDSTAFKARYPDQLADFAMGIDDEYVIDAKDSVDNVACFHPVHMNHSAGRVNVKRYYERKNQRVKFFTIRDIHPEEELLYDYGRQYWRTRGELELP